jgi:predicted transcriptional regulator of viral defense system
LTRTLPPSLAPIVAELELEQPLVVTMDDLAVLSHQAGVRSDVKLVAERLREHGWLLPTTTLGVWEFAPAAHAGPIGHGHPFLGLRAALAAKVIPGAAVCLGSALWAHGLIDRAPELMEVAVSPGTRVPSGLGRAARVVVFGSRLVAVRAKDAPVHRFATILVHLATRPTDVRSWGTVASALADLVAAADRAEIEAELVDRTESVARRLAYLVQALDPQLAVDLMPRPRGKVWFGPRGPLRRHDQRFQIADTVLPFDPATFQNDRGR